VILLSSVFDRQIYTVGNSLRVFIHTEYSTSYFALNLYINFKNSDSFLLCFVLFKCHSTYSIVECCLNLTLWEQFCHIWSHSYTLYSCRFVLSRTNCAQTLRCAERLCEHQSHNDRRSASVWHRPLCSAVHSSSGEQTGPRLADICRCAGRTEYHSHVVGCFSQESKWSEWCCRSHQCIVNIAVIATVCLFINI